MYHPSIAHQHSVPWPDINSHQVRQDTWRYTAAKTDKWAYFQREQQNHYLHTITSFPGGSYSLEIGGCVKKIAENA